MSLLIIKYFGNVLLVSDVIKFESYIFRYRAIDLYEVIIPSDTVVMPKKRNTQHVFGEVEDVFSK